MPEAAFLAGGRRGRVGTGSATSTAATATTSASPAKTRPPTLRAISVGAAGAEGAAPTSSTGSAASTATGSEPSGAPEGESASDLGFSSSSFFVRALLLVMASDVLGLAVVALGAAGAALAAPVEAPAAPAPAEPSASANDASGAPASAVGGVGRALDGRALGAGDVGRLVALLADDDVELDDFAVADRAHGLLGVVLLDGRLVDEHVLLGVVTVDEAVTALDVEPLDRAGDLGGDDLLGLLFLARLVIVAALVARGARVVLLGFGVSVDVGLFGLDSDGVTHDG